MKVEKVGHIDIYVKDLDKAIEFFTKFLGAKFPEPRALAQNDYRVTVTEPLGIALVAPVMADGPVAKTIALKGEGVALVQLRVPNVDEAVDEAKSMGVRSIRVLQGAGRKTALLHPKDTYGVIFELIQS